jgi:hypothetical protein
MTIRTIIVSTAAAAALAAVTVSPTLGAVASAAASPGVTPTSQATSTAPAAGRTCYSALDNDAGVGINSQNYEDSLAEFDDAAATDVILEKKCVVTGLIVPGHHCNKVAPSETVTFYQDRHGKPGKVINTQTVAGDDVFGYFTITIDPVPLPKGTSWVSVVANASLEGFCQWAWELTTDHTGSEDMWQNPAGGFGVCPTWDDVVTCTLADASDLMIALAGKRQR